VAVWQRLANLKQNLVPDILQQQAFFTSLAFQIFRNEFNLDLWQESLAILVIYWTGL